jgi:uncharacterized protein YprB with RNaseH-like and TPR domain
MAVVYLDIETTSKKANEGMIMAIGLLADDEPEVRFSDSFEEERRSLEWLLNKLEDCEMLVTWYGAGFDIPFIVTRAMAHNMDISKLTEIPMLDLYEWSRANLMLSSYSLESASRFLGVGKSKEFQGEDMLTLFKLVERGDVNARKLIVDHCRDDIVMLKRVHERLKSHIERSRWVLPRKTWKEG